MSTQISEELFHAQPSTKPCFSYRSGFSALIHLTSPFTLCLYASQISALLSRIFSLISLVQLSVCFFSLLSVQHCCLSSSPLLWHTEPGPAFSIASLQVSRGCYEAPLLLNMLRFFVLGSPKLGRLLQMQPNEWWVKASDWFPLPTVLQLMQPRVLLNFLSPLSTHPA